MALSKAHLWSTSIFNNSIIVLGVNHPVPHMWLKMTPSRKENILTVCYNIVVLVTINVALVTINILTFDLLFPLPTHLFHPAVCCAQTYWLLDLQLFPILRDHKKADKILCTGIFPYTAEVET